MALSPAIPSEARNRGMQKRVINLINPADPQEFSNTSFSPNSSASVSLDRPPGRMWERQTTPVVEIPARPAFTPRGFDENGVKGILRASGTPGSGNAGELSLCL
jgi:hypothetical protein